MTSGEEAYNSSDPTKKNSQQLSLVCLAVFNHGIVGSTFYHQ